MRDYAHIDAPMGSHASCKMPRPLVESLSRAEQQHTFADTARAWYRLP